MVAESDDRLLSVEDGPEVEEEARGSRFIGQAFRADGEAEASDKLNAIRTRYPDATHHCWALRLGSYGSIHERSDDDGEPARTAGRPILQSLTFAGVTNALVVVTRYYGGTNLGKGGLIRAYGSAARSALLAAPRRETHRLALVECEVAYNDVGAVEGVLGALGDRVVDVDRNFDLFPTFRIRAHAGVADVLATALIDATAGRVNPRVLPL